MVCSSLLSRFCNLSPKGAKTDRPEWLKLLNEIQAGDTLVIWKLDRMGRSLQHLIKIVNDLIAKNVDIISL